MRIGKGQRSWLDAHNVLSVLALPFHLMITYSGLIFLGSIYMPLIVAAFYEGGINAREALDKELYPEPQIVGPAGEPAPLADLAPMFAMLEDRWGKQRIRYMEIHHPGDRNARIMFMENIDASVANSTEQLIFDGVSGELLEAQQPYAISLPKQTYSALTSLHEGIFAGPWLRWLYFFSGLLGTGMIATGLVLWTVKRRPKTQPSKLGPFIVEKLNIGTVVGLPVAMASYFWANRLLPVELTGRADWEAHCLFLVWLGMLIHALVRPVTVAWKEQLLAAAFAFGLIPLLSGLLTERHLVNSLLNGDWIMAGFDLTVLFIGLSLGWVFRQVCVHSTNTRIGVRGRLHNRPARDSVNTET